MFMLEFPKNKILKCYTPFPLNKIISGDPAPFLEYCPPVLHPSQRYAKEAAKEAFPPGICIRLVMDFSSHLPNYFYLELTSHSCGMLGISGEGKVENH